MHRWASAALGLLLALSVAVVVFEGGPARRVVAAAPSASASSAGAPDVASAEASPEGSAPAAELAGEPERPTDHTYDRLPNGKPVPELPATAPKEVGFGVVLVSYRGAQLAPKDAPTKQDARGHALTLLEIARKDFRDATKKGDRGSTEDAGKMPRGVLESSIEYILFTLAVGQVYDEPIDTPRGFWILKRID